VRTPVVAPAWAAPIVALAVLLSGCGSSHTGAGSAGGALHSGCGAAPVTGPALPGVSRRTLPLPGAPDGIATTADGRVSFVALQSGPPRVAVIEHGERLTRTVSVPAYASGMRVTPDGRYVLGAAGRGTFMLAVAGAASGRPGQPAGWLAVPVAAAGPRPGAAEVAVTPDSRYVFVTLERAGAVAVFDLARVTRVAAAPGAFVGLVPVGAGALGIAASPNGRWIYEVSESARRGSERGALNVIDARLAVRDPARSVVATATVTCSPVRVAADGAMVWVTARRANALLGFSAGALRDGAARALVSVTRVGPAPLGLATVAGGRRILVADSSLAGPRGAGSVSVVDAAPGRAPHLLGQIFTGGMPDAISAPGGAAPALVTDSGRRAVALLGPTGLG
jgi:DNA-binding beta-propeller fold protein YncE